MSPPAPTLSPPLSKARRAGDLLFISGQLPRGRSGEIVQGGVAVQTRQAIANLQAVLAEHGGTLADVVKTTVWLTDASLAGAFNAVYRELFAEPYPTRSTVVSGLLVDAHVEIEAVAYLPR
jgi:2-iminobutanoate/2-iminopropanoate deaminase